MMEGEFSSITTIYNLIPSFVPKPLAWGKFELASPDTYFFLCDFVEMSTDMPDPVKFCARVAELHRKGVSPTGKFGFHITTVHGKTEQPVSWDDNWTRYFTRLISHFFAKDLLSNGPWPEYEAAFKRLVDDVIPQVLDPLTSEGRSIRPSLVHGDLWEGNATTDLVTDEPMVFDAAAMYAHNEYELGMWRREIIGFGKPYFKQYLRNMPPSEPVEQWDDRNALYSLKFKLSYCLHRPGLPLVREACVIGHHVAYNMANIRAVFSRTSCSLLTSIHAKPLSNTS
jgi:protein-ribulosamine 3-kinase